MPPWMKLVAMASPDKEKETKKEERGESSGKAKPFHGAGGGAERGGGVNNWLNCKSNVEAPGPLPSRLQPQSFALQSRMFSGEFQKSQTPQERDESLSFSAYASSAALWRIGRTESRDF